MTGSVIVCLLAILSILSSALAQICATRPDLRARKITRLEPTTVDSFVLGLQYDEQICQRRLARLRLGENHLELLRAQELDYTMTTGIDGKGTGLLYILITIVFAFVVMPSQPVFAQERLDSVGLKITRSLSDSSTVLKLDARFGDPCEDGFLARRT